MPGEDGPLIGNVGEPFNAADQPQVDQREAELQRERDEQAADLQWLLRTEQGRRFILRVIGRANPMQVGFYTDPLVMSRCAGERTIGLWLLDELDAADPTAWPSMLLDIARVRQQQAVLEKAKAEREAQSRKD
jgi:hypothetical protein